MFRVHVQHRNRCCHGRKDARAPGVRGNVFSNPWSSSPCRREHACALLLRTSSSKSRKPQLRPLFKAVCQPRPLASELKELGNPCVHSRPAGQLRPLFKAIWQPRPLASELGGWETPVSTAGQPVRLVYFIMYRQKAGREALTWHLGRCFCCFSGRRKQG